MKKLLILVAVLAIAAPAFALTNTKDGADVALTPAGMTSEPSSFRDDFEWSSANVFDEVPTLGGSATGWAEWMLAATQNTLAYDMNVNELSWPCCGAPSELYGWVVWVGDMGGLVPPSGDAYTADHYGPFTPVDPAPDTFPPVVYTYVDVSAEGVVIPAGNFFVFGYDVTGNGGQIDYNGIETWGWYGGIWESDVSWARTCILQIKGGEGGSSPVEGDTWGTIKAMFN